MIRTANPKNETPYISPRELAERWQCVHGPAWIGLPAVPG